MSIKERLSKTSNRIVVATTLSAALFTSSNVVLSADTLIDETNIDIISLANYLCIDPLEKGHITQTPSLFNFEKGFKRIHRSVLDSDLACLNYYIKAGDSPRELSEAGLQSKTPLSILIERWREIPDARQVLKILYNNGAEILGKEKDHEKAYIKAVLSENREAVEALEELYAENGFDPDQVQALRDEALLRVAVINYRTESVDLALNYGADILARDPQGLDVGALMLRELNVEGLQHLRQKHGYSLHRLSLDHPELVLYASALNSPVYNDSPLMHVKLLMVLQDVGTDFEKTIDPNTGKNVAHIAAEKGNLHVLRVLNYWGFDFTQTDNQGQTPQDVASEKSLKYFKWKEQERVTLASNLPQSAGVKALQYFQAIDFPVTNVIPEKQFPDLKFSSDYRPLSFSTDIADNKIRPVVMVAETEGLIPLQELYAQHINETSLTVSGTINALGGTHKPGDVVAIASQPDLDDNKPLNVFSQRSGENEVIISFSMGEAGHYTQLEYLRHVAFSSTDLNHVQNRTTIVHRASGNTGKRACSIIDGASFCIQSAQPFYHVPRLVRVGAASVDPENNRLVAEKYSTYNPTYCALIPRIDDKKLTGTSFAAPASAAIEQRLLDVFGRSNALPEGVIHEDVLMALSLTASHGLVDQETGDIIQPHYSASGFPITDRCGAGVINPQAAADLLSQMVAWTRDEVSVKPTEFRIKSTYLDISSLNVLPFEHGESKELYTYSINVPEDGILINLLAGIRFKDKKGAVAIMLPGAKPIVLDLGVSGLSSEFRVAGVQLNADDKVEIISTKPLDDGSLIDWRMVNLNSPIANAIHFIKSGVDVLDPNIDLQ